MFDFIRNLLTKNSSPASMSFQNKEKTPAKRKVKVANLKVGQTILLAPKDPRRENQYLSYCSYYWLGSKPINQNSSFTVLKKQPKSGPERKHGGLITISDGNNEYVMIYNPQTPVLV